MTDFLIYPYNLILISLLTLLVALIIFRWLSATVYCYLQPKVCLKLIPVAFDELGWQQHQDLMVALAGLNSQSLISKLFLGKINQFSLEIHANYKQGIGFRLICFEDQVDTLKSLLEARYPGIELETGVKLPRVDQGWKVTNFKLSSNYSLPLKIADQEGSGSFLRSVMNALGKECCLSFQLVCQSKKLRNTQRLRYNQAGEVGRATHSSIESKLRQPLLKSSLRVGIKSQQTKTTLTSFRAALNIFTNAEQSLQPKNRLLNRKFKYWQFNERLVLGKDYLATSELASLWYLPEIQAEGLNKLPAKPLPISLASRDKSKFEVVIGQNTYRDQDSLLGLTSQERQRHQYIVGGTGSGKTTMLKYQIIQDIKAGRGVAVLDPHGDLAEELLGYIPKKRIKDVIYINPDDLDHPVGINLLELPDGLKGARLIKEKDLITEAVVSIVRKLFSEEAEGGHRVEYILRNTIQTALYLDEPTLFTLYWLLNNKAYRYKSLRKVTDPALKLFWGQEMSKAGSMQWLKLTIGVTAKVGRFLFSASAREILSQPKSTINFDSTLNEKKIIICNLAKGRLGEDTSSLLGTIILTKLQLAALRRVEQQPDDRTPFYIYVDEFQNFATISFAQMLSEARKYQVFLIMAEQSPKQHKQNRLIDIILANVGTVIAFRSGSAKDTELILPLFKPDINQQQLLNLEGYNFYAKVTSQKTQPPISGTTLLPTSRPNAELSKTIIRSSRRYYT